MKILRFCLLRQRKREKISQFENSFWSILHLQSLNFQELRLRLRLRQSSKGSKILKERDSTRSFRIKKKNFWRQRYWECIQIVLFLILMEQLLFCHLRVRFQIECMKLERKSLSISRRLVEILEVLSSISHNQVLIM